MCTFAGCMGEDLQLEKGRSKRCWQKTKAADLKKAAMKNERLQPVAKRCPRRQRRWFHRARIAPKRQHQPLRHQQSQNQQPLHPFSRHPLHRHQQLTQQHLQSSSTKSTARNTIAPQLNFYEVFSKDNAAARGRDAARQHVADLRQQREEKLHS